LAREVDHALAGDKAIHLWYGKNTAIFYDYRDGYNMLGDKVEMNASSIYNVYEAEKNVR